MFELDEDFLLVDVHGKLPSRLLEVWPPTSSEVGREWMPGLRGHLQWLLWKNNTGLYRWVRALGEGISMFLCDSSAERGSQAHELDGR